MVEISTECFCFEDVMQFLCVVRSPYLGMQVDAVDIGL